MAHVPQRPESPFIHASQNNRNVQAKCFRHDVRPTSAAKRCDTSEETRMQLKERGREKLYPSTAVVTNPNGGRQSMVKVDRSFSVVVNKALLRLPPVIVRSICAELLCRIDCVPQHNHASGP